MKKFLLYIVCASCLLSCTETRKSSNKKSQGAMAHSVGRINELSVVVDNDLWKGRLGDTIRSYYGAETPGLPQNEPLFSMRQIPPASFSGLARKNRTFISIQKGNKTKTSFLKNKYATPQLGAVITGSTEEEIITEIQKHAASIISRLKSTETFEKQKRIRKSLEKIPQLQQKMGITLDIPSVYRIAKEEDNFFWFRKDIQNGDMNLIIYELPLGTVQRDSTAIAKIIHVRDSIGGLKIPTSTGQFITEEAYAPYLFETKLNGKFAFETKGTWEIKDRYMAGPFVNYIIDDTVNNRQLVLEGFILAPSITKRDNMFELESIIKTIKFK